MKNFRCLMVLSLLFLLASPSLAVAQNQIFFEIADPGAIRQPMTKVKVPVVVANFKETAAVTLRHLTIRLNGKVVASSDLNKTLPSLLGKTSDKQLRKALDLDKKTSAKVVQKARQELRKAETKPAVYALEVNLAKSGDRGLFKRPEN